MWFLFRKLEPKVTPIQRSTVPTAGVRTKYSSWSSHISSHIQSKFPVLAREKRRKNTDKAGYLQLHMQRTPRDPEGIIVWMLFKQPVQQRILAPIYLLLPWVSGNIDLCQQRNGWSTALRQWLLLVKSSASILGDDNLFTQSFQLGIKMHRYWSGCKTQTLKHHLKMVGTGTSSFISSKPLCNLLASHLQPGCFGAGSHAAGKSLDVQHGHESLQGPQTVCTVKKGSCKTNICVRPLYHILSKEIIGASWRFHNQVFTYLCGSYQRGQMMFLMPSAICAISWGVHRCAKFRTISFRCSEATWHAALDPTGSYFAHGVTDWVVDCDVLVLLHVVPVDLMLTSYKTPRQTVRERK